MLGALWGMAMMSALSDHGRPYLDVARKAAAWIKAERPRLDAPHRSDASLYGGSSGVLLFFCEFAHATGDPANLKPVEAQAKEVALESEKMEDCGLYSGLCGAEFSLDAGVRLLHSDIYHRAAERCMERVNGFAKV